MSKKIKVGLIFGGKSAEHEVSLQSAKNVAEAIDKNKYEVVLIGVDKNGHWCLQQPGDYLLNENDPKSIRLKESGEEIVLHPGSDKDQFLKLSEKLSIGEIEVIFPIIHGSMGEDGSLQGFLKISEIAFVGSGIMASSVGMDKDVTKRLLKEAGIPVADFVVLKKYAKNNPQFNEIKEKLGLPLFIKPANMGSSIGISKVCNQEEFEKSLAEAFRYDFKVLVEKYIKGREIEVAVLGNDQPQASVPGEIIVKHDFYSYEAKYLDENGAILEAPAKLSPEETEQARELAIKVFQTLGCEGMARVDFFFSADGTYYVNEVNTIPGFTKISMYPRLWMLSGLSYPELIERLLTLALERKAQENLLETSYFQ